MLPGVWAALKTGKSAVNMMNDSWSCWLMIREIWTTVLHATLKSLNPRFRLGCQFVKPQQLLLPSLGHSAFRIFWSSDRCEPVQGVFALICWLSNLCLNPQMFPCAVSNEPLVGFGTFYPAPTTRSMVRQVAGSVSSCVQLSRTNLNKLLLFFGNPFIATIVIYENQAVK